MFESGITGFSIRDQSIRRRTGDEQPKGAMPPMNDPFCVRRDAIPDCCAECAYGGNTDRNAADISDVICSHPSAPKNMRIVSSHMAKSIRQPWCPLTTGTFN